MQSQQKTHSISSTIGAIWGLVGVLMLLTSATMRLTPLAIDAFYFSFSGIQWAALVVIVIGMAYAEGYKGFQQGFSPRVAARAKYIRDNPRLLHTLLAPFFCMGYFHATKKRRIVSISLTLGIIVLILLVRLLRQPWRGIIDAGVVVGLAWGMVSLVIFSIKAFFSPSYDYSPEVPEGD